MENIARHVSNASVFVTGADGFIGSHVVEACVRAGAKLKALSCYSSFDADGWLDDLTPDVRASVEVLRGDVRDATFLRSAFKGTEVVFHLAALIGIPYSYNSPSSYVDVNVGGTLNVLMAARDAGARRVVHTSTSEVYGTARTCPIDEEHPLHAQSPYAASKIGADKMVEAMFNSFGLPVVTLRPFNTYGPRQSQRAVIPTVVRQVIDPGCHEIEIGDLSTKRDWMFVEDTARAFLAVAGDSALIGETYNAGTGAMVSVATMVDEVRRIAGSTKPVVSRAERVRPDRSEVRVLQADSSRLETATGWRARVTLAEGLERTIEWWKRRGSEISRLSPAYRV